jgi:hypothetical protein
MNVFWPVWIILIGVTFAFAEGYALWKGKMTLSRWVWTVSKDFPPFPWMVGVVVGFLACHFWWGGEICFAPVTGG